MKTGFLIDMDGVIYRENQLIPGAADFVRALVETGQASDRLNSPALSPKNPHDRITGQNHQTDVSKFLKPRPRPAMTKS